MLRSFYAGISGLRNHQQAMDVVGSNLANVNTTGYKASRTTFMDTLSQTIQGTRAGGTETGGKNAMQVGLGMTVAAIDRDVSQGALQSTGRNLDMAIEGDGWFVVGNTSKTGDKNFYYTRAGNFFVDDKANLVTAGGDFVYGWVDTDKSGTISSSQDNMQFINLDRRQDGAITNVLASATPPISGPNKGDATIKTITTGPNTVSDSWRVICRNADLGLFDVIGSRSGPIAIGVNYKDQIISDKIGNFKIDMASPAAAKLNSTFTQPDGIIEKFGFDFNTLGADGEPMPDLKFKFTSSSSITDVQVVKVGDEVTVTMVADASGLVKSTFKDVADAINSELGEAPEWQLYDFSNLTLDGATGNYLDSNGVTVLTRGADGFTDTNNVLVADLSGNALDPSGLKTSADHYDFSALTLDPVGGPNGEPVYLDAPGGAIVLTKDAVTGGWLDNGNPAANPPVAPKLVADAAGNALDPLGQLIPDTDDIGLSVTFSGTNGAGTHSYATALINQTQVVRSGVTHDFSDGTNVMTLGDVAPVGVMSWTANDTGGGGNNLNIALINRGAQQRTTEVVVSGNNIKVYLAADSSGNVVATAGDVYQAFKDSVEASDLVTMTNPAGPDPLNDPDQDYSEMVVQANSEQFFQGGQGANEGDYFTFSTTAPGGAKLSSVSVNQEGGIIGVFENGSSEELGRISVARISNPQGLIAVGEGKFATSPVSGIAVPVEPGTEGTGGIASGFLEMSNVDLTREFTDMIVMQRGFQANSRIITTSDEMLQELMQLKR